jgi:manganese transport protein
MSQVVLSMALPLPMISLLSFTGRPDILDAFTNSRLTRILSLLGTAAVLAVNVVLIAQTLGVPIPGLSSGESGLALGATRLLDERRSSAFCL